MKKTTLQIIESALKGDFTVSPAARETVMEIIAHAAEPVKLINAAEAASIYGMARSSWSGWKNNDSINGKSKVPFPFTVYPTEAGERFNLYEILARINQLAKCHPNKTVKGD